MKNHLLLSTLALVLSQTAIADPSLPDIKEGMWELSFKSDIAAMPTPMPSVAYSSKHCLSKQSAGDPQTLLQNNNCTISNLKQQPTLVTWDMRCEQQGIQMTGNGNVNYSHESFSGTFNMTMQSEGAESLKITTQASGRYLGNCK